MPVAFGLGFQNNFHLLSVNWWQPWELGVKAPMHQTVCCSLIQGIWDAHFSFLGLHTVVRMGLVSLVITVSCYRDLRS